MRQSRALALVILLLPACHRSVSSAAAQLAIAPDDALLDVAEGQMPILKFTAALENGGTTGDDVTARSTFTLADASLGTMQGNVFVPAMGRAGDTTVTASFPTDKGPITATAKLRVRHYAGFVQSCMGCPPFPDLTAPSCNGASPQLVYPTEDLLVPPNLNRFEVQFTPGSATATMFELDIQNRMSDVRIAASCQKILDTHMNDTGACHIDLDPAVWQALAAWNRGGEPLTLTVRASNAAGCATPTPSSHTIALTEHDLAGIIYYWTSTSGDITAGNVYRNTFGEDTHPEKVLTGFKNINCFGCHSLSRDGKRMTFNADDDNADDEYGDVLSGLYDITQSAYLTDTIYGCGQVPGFQTFNRDHSLYLGSLGNASGDMAQVYQKDSCATWQSIATTDFYLSNGDTASLSNPFAIVAAPAGQRPTQPDWSFDDKNVVYVIGQKYGGGMLAVNDDTHVFGGSLWTMPYLGNGKFGPPASLLSAQKDSSYYPSYSPDENFVVYNRVPIDQTLASIDTCKNGECPNDSFSNPRARVSILPTKAGAQPIDCEKLNGSPAKNPVPYSNSWPRWSPFVQKYQGSELLWVVFSSTRDYGLRVRNHRTVNGRPMAQCYPPGAPENPGLGGFDERCQQPQLWMAAINLTTAGELQGGSDPSYPAFWLPFQDVAAHNHTAQWTTVGGMPGPCIAVGGDCSQAPDNCCGANTCHSDGTCGPPIG